MPPFLQSPQVDCVSPATPYKSALELLEASRPIPIIENRLYFVCLPDGSALSMAAGHKCYFYTTEHEMVYQRFFADFGPLHLSHLVTFCRRTQELLANPTHAGKTIYYYTSPHRQRLSNAALLILAFAVTCLGKSPEEAFTPFFALDPPLLPFRDAAFGACTYHLSVLNSLRGLARAISVGHFDLTTFDVAQYNHLTKLEAGDINWIIPGKLLAFSGPLSQRRPIDATGATTLLAEDYVAVFKRLGVKCVVRFNDKCYDRRRFLEAGIKHVDLFYEDGGNPGQKVLQRFLAVCEETNGAIAVHCKAGLGRTGTNIALYMMKHQGYTAAESIAWIRICRPGSIVGPQQIFLEAHQSQMWREGAAMTASKAVTLLEPSNTSTSYPPVGSPLAARQRIRSASIGGGGSRVFNSNGGVRRASVGGIDDKERTWTANTVTQHAKQRRHDQRGGRNAKTSTVAATEKTVRLETQAGLVSIVNGAPVSPPANNRAGGGNTTVRNRPVTSVCRLDTYSRRSKSGGRIIDAAIVQRAAVSQSYDFGHSKGG